MLFVLHRSHQGHCDRLCLCIDYRNHHCTGYMERGQVNKLASKQDHKKYNLLKERRQGLYIDKLKPLTVLKRTQAEYVNSIALKTDRQPVPN